ncbi:MAG: SRPBCC domain-containing protein [Actinomycetota bacterium]
MHDTTDHDATDHDAIDGDADSAAIDHDTTDQGATDHDPTDQGDTDTSRDVDQSDDVGGPGAVSDGRSIEVTVDVVGTPDDVWRAVATGAGISSWYVAHAVEEREGGEVRFSFGPGMEATGRVAVWDPPTRFLIDNGEQVGLAFEWTIEPLPDDEPACRVRLVNSGFGADPESLAQLEAMRNGWGIFLTNLRLHLEHFPGRSATPSLPMAMWPAPRDEAWARLLGDLGLPAELAAGERVTVSSPDAPAMSGTVAAVGADHVAFVLDEPTAGTAFLAAESVGDAVAVSVWSYLYDDVGAELVARDQGAWQEWLSARADDPDARR